MEQHGYQPTHDLVGEPPQAPDFNLTPKPATDPTTDLCCVHGANLDRIEQKLDQLLNTRLRFTSSVDPDAIRREFTKADRARHQRLFLLPEQPEDKPKWNRWKTAAAVVGLVLGFAAVAALGLWLWVLVIRAVA